MNCQYVLTYFLRLQDQQAVTRFASMSGPSLLRGILWSMVSFFSSPERPQ